MEKWKTRSIANNYKKLAHWNLPIESYERWLLRLFYLGWIVTKNGSKTPAMAEKRYSDVIQSLEVIKIFEGKKNNSTSLNFK